MNDTHAFSMKRSSIENESDQKNFKSKFFRSFSENYFSPRFMLPCSLLAKNIFCFSKSAPTPRYTILDSRLPVVIRSRKAGLPFATRARKRELSIREVHIENDSDRKFSKSKFFWKPLFSTFHATLFIISRIYFFGFSK